MQTVLRALGSLVVVCICVACTEEPLPFDPAAALEKQVSGENAYKHVEALVAIGPRPSGSDALEQSLVYLTTALEAEGWQVLRQELTANTPEGEKAFTNLRARFAPTGEVDWDQKVRGILCSHYDTKLYTRFEFVGANDGGSSTGLLVELARVLATRPEAARDVELVFFDGEEAFGTNITGKDGLYGSKYYSAQLLANPKQVPDWGLLLDMVGDQDLKIRAGVQIPGSSIQDLLLAKESGHEIDRESVKASVKVMSRQLLAVSKDLGLKGEVGISPNYIVDDHVPLNIVAGVPTIDLIDFDYPYWHTPGDTLDKISPESLETSGRVALQLVEKYLLGPGE